MLIAHCIADTTVTVLTCNMLCLATRWKSCFYNKNCFGKDVSLLVGIFHTILTRFASTLTILVQLRLLCHLSFIYMLTHVYFALYNAVTAYDNFCFVGIYIWCLLVPIYQPPTYWFTCFSKIIIDPYSYWTPVALNLMVMFVTNMLLWQTCYRHRQGFKKRKFSWCWLVILLLSNFVKQIYMYLFTVNDLPISLTG